MQESEMSYEMQEHLQWVEAQIVEAFHEAGLNVAEEDAEAFKAEMREKKVEVRKIINGPESGFHILKDNILIKFIPSAKIDGVVV